MNRDPWSEQLRSAAADVDSLVISHNENDATSPTSNELFRLQDQNVIQEFLNLIDIDIAESGFHCMCDGDYFIDLYRRHHRIIRIGYHQGLSLRWHDGSWDGDGFLTLESQLCIPWWLKENGFNELWDQRSAELAEKKRKEQERDAFASFFPVDEALKILWPDAQSSGKVSLCSEFMSWRSKATANKICQLIGDPVDVTMSVCQALGSLRKEWNSYDDMEECALAAIGVVNGTDFLKALPKMQDDHTALLGAARVFFWLKFMGKLPQDDRVIWALRLAKTVLQDTHDTNKFTVLERLTGVRDPSITSLLWQVAMGTMGRELVDPHARSKFYPGIRAGAVLMLAFLKEKSVKDLAQSMLKYYQPEIDRSATESALALLGDSTRVRKEHFRNYCRPIAYASLQAIMHSGGSHGLDILINELPNNSNYQFDLVLMIQRVSGMRWISGKKLIDRSLDYQEMESTIQAIQLWWNEFGRNHIEEYAAKQQKLAMGCI